MVRQRQAIGFAFSAVVQHLALAVETKRDSPIACDWVEARAFNHAQLLWLLFLGGSAVAVPVPNWLANQPRSHVLAFGLRQLVLLLVVLSWARESMPVQPHVARNVAVDRF